MESIAGFHVRPSEGEKPGAFVCFPFDRATLERFRAEFPRARWRGEEACWWVPGPTAARRLDLWVSRELAELDRHADDKGRDAYAFEPLESRYLEVAEDLGVRTPYSRTVVDIMRQIPWARWDPQAKAWRIPFRSYEPLRERWPEIEEAARWSEPEARRARKPTPEERAVQAERRRQRLPVPAGDPPPLGEPVAASLFGVVVVEALDEAEIAPGGIPAVYESLNPAPRSWAHWRLPTWRELARGKPAEEEPDPGRGWWPPTAEDLERRRRIMRETQRARETRAKREG